VLCAAAVQEAGWVGLVPSAVCPALICTEECQHPDNTCSDFSAGPFPSASFNVYCQKYIGALKSGIVSMLSLE
jgi:hypothetical protein